ncbi:sensor histidine kinase, partial [Mycolicibacterium houstonense]|uniref:sensor histidine kinase n=1 Tax=Mycolicibacterium houstonense TaxID=146021 RepID=UPI000B01C1ED
MTPSPVAAHTVVAAAVAAAQDRFDDKGVGLHRRVPENLPSLWADPHRLAQILGNLLDNALRHTPAGGQVTIEAGMSADSDTVELTVTDTGEGIPAEHLPHVFERFYRADTARDRDHGGSGIGLAIVKALVEAHGG